MLRIGIKRKLCLIIFSGYKKSHLPFASKRSVIPNSSPLFTAGIKERCDQLRFLVYPHWKVHLHRIRRSNEFQPVSLRSNFNGDHVRSAALSRRPYVLFPKILAICSSEGFGRRKVNVKSSPLLLRCPSDITIQYTIITENMLRKAEAIYSIDTYHSTDD